MDNFPDAWRELVGANPLRHVRGLSTAPEFLEPLKAMRPADVRIVIVDSEPFPGAASPDLVADELARSDSSMLERLDSETETESVPREQWDAHHRAQGVLRLYLVPVVGADPHATRGVGWEECTLEVLVALARATDRQRAFLLWGAYVRSVCHEALRANRAIVHCVTYPHPDSHNRGRFAFSGSLCFAKAAVDVWSIGEPYILWTRRVKGRRAKV